MYYIYYIHFIYVYIICIIYIYIEQNDVCRVQNSHPTLHVEDIYINILVHKKTTKNLSKRNSNEFFNL